MSDLPPFSEKADVIDSLINTDSTLIEEKNQEILIQMHLPDFSEFGASFTKQINEGIEVDVKNAMEKFEESYQRISDSLDKFKLNDERKENMLEIYICKTIKELSNQYSSNSTDTTRNAFNTIVAYFGARAAAFHANKSLLSIYGLDLSKSEQNQTTYINTLEKARSIYVTAHNKALVANESNLNNQYSSEANKLFTRVILELISTLKSPADAQLQLGILTERFLQRHKGSSNLTAIAKNWNNNFGKLTDTLLSPKAEEPEA